LAKPPKSKLAQYAEYLALRVIGMTLNSWPVDFGLWLGGTLGDFMFHFDKKHRDRAMGNLRKSFPEKDERWIRDMARRSFRNEIFYLGVEFFFTTRKIKLDAFTRVLKFDDFGETLDLMLRNDRGLVLLTGHYGNWEVAGYAMAMVGFETVSVARPLDNPYVYDYVIGVRERQGQRIIAKKGMTEEVQAALEQKQLVGFIADQDAGKKGLFVDFFGRKASTYKSIGLLAMHYQTPIIISYARRVEGKYQFVLGTQDVIHPRDWEGQPDPLLYITQRYTRAIEDMIRTDPSQYLWVHRRWKHRPRGEAPETFD
jgi:Kdo2-lipid IVA lauroyltransferase/acyltransferase